MPFLDHLEELRWRVLYSLLAIVVATLAGWFIVERVDVIGLLIRPPATAAPKPTRVSDDRCVTLYPL